jgi:hypothetical protein
VSPTIDLDLDIFGVESEADREEASRRRAIVAGLSEYKHVLHLVNFESDDYDLGEDGDPEVQKNATSARRRVSDAAEANAISSLLLDEDGMHTVAVDIDHRMTVVPSSTEGHGHLYIDVKMPWEDYLKLLRVMAEVGLVEPGYVAASERRSATHLRLPWESK